MLASEIFTEAAALLNDPNKGTYTDVKMLPMLRRAYDSLSSEFALYGAQLLSEESAVQDIAAGILVATAITDMLYPVRIYERADGETNPEAWEPMHETSFVEKRNRQSSLMNWTWEEDIIKFTGSDAAREIMIHYKKSFPVIADGTTTLALANGKPYLAAKAAALAAMFIGENPTRAGILETEAQTELNKLTAVITKRMQGAGAVHRINPYEQIF